MPVKSSDIGFCRILEITHTNANKLHTNTHKYFHVEINGRVCVGMSSNKTIQRFGVTHNPTQIYTLV